MMNQNQRATDRSVSVAQRQTGRRPPRNVHLTKPHSLEQHPTTREEKELLFRRVEWVSNSFLTHIVCFDCCDLPTSRPWFRDCPEGCVCEIIIWGKVCVPVGGSGGIPTKKTLFYSLSEIVFGA